MSTCGGSLIRTRSSRRTLHREVNAHRRGGHPGENVGYDRAQVGARATSECLTLRRQYGHGVLVNRVSHFQGALGIDRRDLDESQLPQMKEALIALDGRRSSCIRAGS